MHDVSVEHTRRRQCDIALRAREVVPAAREFEGATPAIARTLFVGAVHKRCVCVAVVQADIEQEVVSTAGAGSVSLPKSNPVSDVHISRISTRFIGHSALEKEYSERVFVQKTFKVIGGRGDDIAGCVCSTALQVLDACVCLCVTCCVQLTVLVVGVVIFLSITYMAIEAFIGSGSLRVMTIRAILVTMGGFFLVGMYTSVVRKHFQLAVFVLILVGGVAKTLLIERSGEFGQTLFQLAILLVLRVKFVSVIVLSIVDLTVFIIAAIVNDHYGSNLIFFLGYMLFVLGFASSGCYRLQVSRDRRTHVHVPCPSRVRVRITECCVACCGRWPCERTSCRTSSWRWSARSRRRFWTT